MTDVQGWTERSLIDLAEYINGYAFKPDDWEAEGLPIVRIEQLRDPTAPTDYYSKQLPAKSLIQDGDLIFSWSASLFLRIWQYGPAVLNQHLFKVIEKDNVDRAFLKLFIEFYLPDLIKASHGSTMQHITRKELKRFRAMFPDSKVEQIKIAEILLSLDKAIEQTEALIAKQQNIQTGLMHDLLTRGIDEHGNLRTEATHEFKDSPLGRIPVEWNVKELGAIAGLVTSGSRGWATHYSVEGVPFLRIGNLTRNHINLYLNDLVFVNPPKGSEGKRTKVSAGDLLISITADLGIIGVIPENFGEAYVNQHIALIRLEPGEANSRFTGWYLSGRNGQAQFASLNDSGAKAGLNLPTVKKLYVPVTESDEHARIAEIIDAATNAENQFRRKLDKLRAIKSGLMHDLLTGNKRVTALFTETGVATA
jgi:type I restriction enzyme S subunit